MRYPDIQGFLLCEAFCDGWFRIGESNVNPSDCPVFLSLHGTTIAAFARCTKMHLLSSEMATLRGRWRAVLMRHLGDRVRGGFSARNVVLYIPLLDITELEFMIIDLE